MFYISMENKKAHSVNLRRHTIPVIPACAGMTSLSIMLKLTPMPLGITRAIVE
jgi:hypothetical protein